MSRLSARTHSLLAFICFALVACEAVGAQQLQQRSNNGQGFDLARRQQISIPNLTTDQTTSTTSTSSDTKATGTTTTTTSSTSTSTTSSTTSSNTTPTNTGTNTTPTNTRNTQSSSSSSSSSQTAPPESSLSSVIQTTNADGSTIFQTVVVPASDSGSSTSSSASATSTSDNDSSSGLGTGSIIGLSVAGGIAVIGVVAFFIWKFTRKRFGDFDDEPIKWPELNAHDNDANYAPPSSGTKGLDSASEVNLTRNPSGAGYTHSAFSQPSAYTNQTAADSTAELYAPGSDPYAVPPLPHLNPNTPYRDDPNYGPAGGYYDPYRGPVPQTFNDSASINSTGRGYAGVGGEAIPMSNLNSAGVIAQQTGRMSPGPQMSMSRAASPLPPASGRMSPGPGVSYNSNAAASGRMSPGPGPAYGGVH